MKNEGGKISEYWRSALVVKADGTDGTRGRVSIYKQDAVVIWRSALHDAADKHARLTAIGEEEPREKRHAGINRTEMISCNDAMHRARAKTRKIRGVCPSMVHGCMTR